MSTSKRRRELELPESLLDEIRKRLEKRVSELKKYVIPQNSDDHLMLVAVPIARDVIEDVLFAEDVVETILPWMNVGETKGMWSRHTRIEELATRFAVDLVRHYRPDFTPDHLPQQTARDFPLRKSRA